jgi:5-methylcytosine-specific restriction endonuclease McrA
MPSICKGCGCTILGNIEYEFCSDCDKPPRTKRNPIWLAAVKALGGECAECGAKDNLQIDHVNNDGAEERKRMSNNEILRKVAEELILNNGVSNNYQVLCQTCNIRKRFRKANPSTNSSFETA